MPRGAGVRLKDLPPEMRESARAMKRQAADAERRAACDYFAGAGLPRPEPEYRFHPRRKWRMDFSWPGARVALEVEGAIYGMGPKCPACGQRDRRKGHTSASDLKKDLEKYSEAAAMGWRIVRCTPEELYEPRTLDWLRRALQRAQADAA